MLEQFQIPEDVAVRVSGADMGATVEAMFMHYGMSAERANNQTTVGNRRNHACRSIPAISFQS